ncbi:DUF397 domain-containing protein [Streptomyces alfalfae]|uniref:DUF397 domain-containing protein n=1 Tax=Streptomyces alfalfae TaxID=1642299 RepID=A0ABN4VJK6_9ACTN|nr:DUF397 domain-containing protein [Streptomyces alfalfae]AYA17269.1 DUF397 domain-containing protein [Streptomyces fradiae]APY86874.1 DUF397 domain-containing protein [Streptomyces alfalfae]QUI33354.1 DUF397 domain-containing protein [Streptomyces alfalfae]RXX37523.1 DUF397 domain-containing protein [Streptomyces alfalfae]RZM99343.1 DUF397 domain-containing protein [Streptomyces alfalfae]
MIRKTSVGDSSEPAWFKSSYSSNSNEPDCVEVAHAPSAVHVRDSKVIQGPRLTVGDTAWAEFLTYAAGS